MTQLFSPSMLREIRGLPGASHSFVKQLCANGTTEERLRYQINSGLEHLPDALRLSVAERLSSLDNRRFFQGFAELATARVLQRGAWTLADPGSTGFQAVRPSGMPVNVLVLSFVHAGALGLDRQRVTLLEQTLGRVSARTRFVVSVRRWLPQGFQAEPVRQAVELWLREVEAGRWKTRYAAYEDEAVSLEFGLVGELDSPVRASGEQAAPLLTLGPFGGAIAMSAIESKVILELDRLRMSPEGHQPVLLSAVGDRPWGIPHNTLQAFFYGKPRWIQTSWEPGTPEWEACLSREAEPCLYKDPLYQGVLGTLLLHRSAQGRLDLGGVAWSNPFAPVPLSAPEIPLDSIAAYSSDEERPVLRRFSGAKHVSIAGALP